MSITEELRGLAADPLLGYASQKVHAEAITAIADRIDAEHERVCYDYQREFEDWKFVHNTDFVELPKDADGVSIHIGDKVTHCGRRVYEVNAISFFKDNVSVSFNGESGCGCDSGKNFHHYHEPTVEDVLREFAQRWDEPMRYDRDEMVEQYAAKLKLADNGEERQ